MNQLIPIGETAIRRFGKLRGEGSKGSRYVLIPANQAPILARDGFTVGRKLIILRDTESNDIILRLADTGEEEG